ncbi:unnamed protein product [Cuscuta campestris]|uniref:Uncharacterized protein n=1 Tax=Cuscuta campestris TaxID=132261 RepID=A0A484N1H4_9ASTE|nr:unnamed protein product [Cuscuta campestris]
MFCSLFRSFPCSAYCSSSLSAQFLFSFYLFSGFGITVNTSLPALSPPDVSVGLRCYRRRGWVVVGMLCSLFLFAELEFNTALAATTLMACTALRFPEWCYGCSRWAAGRKVEVVYRVMIKWRFGFL